MFGKYKYTDKELDSLLDSIVILTDSREQVNGHITGFFDEKNIAWKKMGLQQGDYSFYIPANEALHIDRDIYFNKEVAIERKNSLEELSGSFTKSRTQLKTEFSQFKGDMQLMIENGSYKDIVEGNYNTKYNKKSYTASLHSMSSEFGVPFIFIDREYSGLYIYMHLRYWLRDLIK